MNNYKILNNRMPKSLGTIILPWFTIQKEHGRNQNIMLIRTLLVQLHISNALSVTFENNTIKEHENNVVWASHPFPQI